MSSRLSPILLALAAIALPAPAPAFVSASSQVIQISAIAFAVRSNSVADGDENQGTLTNGQGKYYATVPFNSNGMRVCSFTLVHRDNDADSGITARLLKKNIVLGASPFDPPLQMARVTTGVAGATSGVATKIDLTIAQPVINTRTAFYYVELELGSTLLEALGVQIEVNSTCGG